MPEVLAVAAVLALVAAGLRPALQDALVGASPAAGALAPLARAARAARRRALRVEGLPLLACAAAVARLLLVPVGGRPLLDPTAGVALLLVLEAVVQVASRWRATPVDRFGAAVLPAAAAVVALAAPAVAAGTLQAGAAARGAGLPVGIEAPVALVVLLAAARGGDDRIAPLVLGTGAPVIASLLLGGGQAAVLLGGLGVVVVATAGSVLLPQLRPERLRGAAAAALGLAAAQLFVVATLAAAL